MITLSLVLSKIVLLKLPFGGSVTLGHHVPLILISYKLGYKLGLITSIIYSLIHLILSFKIPFAKDFFCFILLILLDYIFPYAVIGLSSFFEFFKCRFNKIYMGVLISFILKIFISTISGIILWNSYIPSGVNIWVYSLIYNTTYIIPEYIITTYILYNLNNFHKH